MKDKLKIKQILDSLERNENYIQRNKPLQIVYTKSKRSKKVRRHSGRRFPRLNKPNIKWSQIIKEALEPKSEWNDWLDYRDGMRAIWSDKFKKYHWRKSNKVYKEIQIRKAKQGK